VEFFFPRQASIVDKLRFPSIANNSPGNRITSVEIHGGCSKTFYLLLGCFHQPFDQPGWVFGVTLR
jgi:hypothetical protein